MISQRRGVICRAVAAAILVVVFMMLGLAASAAVNCPAPCQLGRGVRGEAPHASVDRPLYVGDLPSVLYRVDSPGPPGTEPTFRDFIPGGVGTSIVDHALTGAFMDQHAFVSTTSSPVIATRFAEGLRAAGLPTWIYSIDADEGFYNVSQSLDWIHDHAPNDSARYRAATAQFLMDGMDLWVTLGAITMDQVREVHEVRNPLDPSVDFRSQNLRVITNPRREQRPEIYVRASRQLLTE